MSRVIPTPIGYEAIDLSWIKGRAITEVSFRDPACWCFGLGTPEHITVECLWRIVRAGRVVLTGLDHGRRFGFAAPADAACDAMEALSGNCVTDVQLREATADISMTFEGELCLEIIPDSGGYESWQLHAPGGRWYVAQGGGQICTWTQ